jgi:Na+-transporting NADH:ubiquinone oxidoreductase subunit A
MTVVKIRKGFDVPIHGGLESVVPEDGPAIRHVALKPQEAWGIKVKLHVHIGQKVRLGEPLFHDKRDEAVQFTAPGAGEVVAIHRGKRRMVQSVVIRLDDSEEQVPFAALDPVHADADAIRGHLLLSGLWPCLRQRPYDTIARSNEDPLAIFVTATETRPLAPPPLAVLEGREAHFRAGLVAMTKLSSGNVHLCTADGGDWGGFQVDGVRHTRFAGKHPAGNVGVHINALEPVGAGRTVWHVGYQDLADIGEFLSTGHIPTRRTVALVGPAVTRPALLRTRRGASTEELTAGRLAEGEALRLVSGSVLGGWTAQPGTAYAFLGRWDNMLSVLSDAVKRDFLGWLNPLGSRHTFTNSALAKFLRRRFDFDTDTNGGDRAIVPIGSYDQVMPMDILATPLIKALASGDMEQAEKLGVLELAEEDLALCEYVCPSKIPVTSLLRDMLERIEKEG